MSRPSTSSCAGCAVCGASRCLLAHEPQATVFSASLLVASIKSETILSKVSCDGGAKKSLASSLSSVLFAAAFGIISTSSVTMSIGIAFGQSADWSTSIASFAAIFQVVSCSIPNCFPVSDAGSPISISFNRPFNVLLVARSTVLTVCVIIFCHLLPHFLSFARPLSSLVLPSLLSVFLACCLAIAEYRPLLDRPSKRVNFM